MKHRVVFSPEAGEQLAALYRYIVTASSGEVAERYTEAIVSYCERLVTFQIRGVQRDDIRPGLRITNYKRRAVIAFAVSDDEVSILGVFYGGRDYESMLQDDDE